MKKKTTSIRTKATAKKKVVRPIKPTIEKPMTKVALDAIVKKKSVSEIKKLNFGIFDKYDPKEKNYYLKQGEIHFLFPKDWYNKIPEGYPVVGIGGNTEKFKRGISDDDSREGFLPYGFIKKEKN